MSNAGSLFAFGLFCMHENTGSRFAPGRINVEPTGLSREILTAVEDVLLVELMHLVFTRMPVRVTVGDSGLCCCTCDTYFVR